MMWLKRVVRRWVAEAARDDMHKGNTLEVAIGSNPTTGTMNGEAHVSVSLRKAMNGLILEMGTYKPDPRGPDWTYKHYILKEGEDVAAAVAALLVNHRLNS